MSIARSRRLDVPAHERARCSFDTAHEQNTQRDFSGFQTHSNAIVNDHNSRHISRALSALASSIVESSRDRSVAAESRVPHWCGTRHTRSGNGRSGPALREVLAAMATVSQDLKMTDTPVESRRQMTDARHPEGAKTLYQILVSKIFVSIGT